MTPLLHTVIAAMGVMRIVIGLAPLVAPGPASRLLRFPAAHDNATARLMGRLFGVRDVGLGVLVFYALAHPAFLDFSFLFQAAMDGGDLLDRGPARAPPGHRPRRHRLGRLRLRGRRRLARRARAGRRLTLGSRRRRTARCARMAPSVRCSSARCWRPPRPSRTAWPRCWRPPS
ncbi:MAG: DUF4267 domain-containing protein [Myxococcota bacterium]